MKKLGIALLLILPIGLLGCDHEQEPEGLSGSGLSGSGSGSDFSDSDFSDSDFSDSDFSGSDFSGSGFSGSGGASCTSACANIARRCGAASVRDTCVSQCSESLAIFPSIVACIATASSCEAIRSCEP